MTEKALDVTTALALIIRGPNGNKINEIRSKYDRAYPRWEPHINFLFPFVPMEQFDEIMDKLQKALKDFGEFNLNLNEIGFFKQGRNSTIHLKTKDSSKLEEIFNIIRATIPDVKPKHAEFNPHLTLAQCKRKETEEMVKMLQEWLDVGINEKVDRIYIINRSKEDKNVPFSIHSEIKLI